MSQLQAIALELQTWLKLDLLNPETDQNLTELKPQLSNLNRLSQNFANHPELLPYSVEINKQIRLLDSDLTMLATARQPEKKSLRQAQIFKRLELLLSYCNSCLSILTELRSG
jgi:hypothetical protein